MRSVAWGLLKRTTRRRTSVLPRLQTRQINYSAPVLSSSPASLSDNYDTQINDQSSFRPSIQSRVNTEEHFLTYLNGAQPASSLGLPTGISLQDAYLYLRETAPSTLAHVSDDALAQLCMQAGVKRLGGVIGSLIDDLEGKALDEIDVSRQDDILSEVPSQLRDANVASKGGIFKAAPGSKRRLNAVQCLILGTSRRQRSNGIGNAQIDNFEGEGIGFVEHLLSSSVLERAFAMLINDFQSLKKEKADLESSSPLPEELDCRVARRLIRSISTSGDVKLAPILGELIRHVKRYDEADHLPFPQPMEGCYLLEFYLGLQEDANVDSFGQSSSSSSSSSFEMPQPLQAAHYILEEMIAADPVTLSVALVDTASNEGHHYSSYLAAVGVPQMEASKQGLLYTIRNIVINVLLKKSRYSMLQDRLQLLVDAVKQTVTDINASKSSIYYKRPIRSSINLALASDTGVSTAIAIAKQFPTIWPFNLDSENGGALLRVLCECAIRNGKEQEALQILETALTQSRPPRNRLANAAVFVGGEALTSIIRFQAKIGRGDIVVHLLNATRIMNDRGEVIDDAIDQLFPPPTRADFIVVLAEARLKAQSKAFYERWGAPLDYVVDSNMVQSHIKQVVQTSISKSKPAGHEISLGSSQDLYVSVKQSSKCLVQLVKLFSERPENRKFSPSVPRVSEHGALNLDGALIPHKHVQFAYHVLFQYLGSPPNITLLHRKHFVRLASAYYRLDQRAAAFKCLGDIMRREESPTVEEAVELLRLLSRISLEKTIQLLLERIAIWTRTDSDSEVFQNKTNLSKLYSALLGHCLYIGKFDLAEKLMVSARDNGLEDFVSIRALNGLIKYAFEQQDVKFADLTNSSPNVDGINLYNNRGGNTLYLAKWIKTLMDKEDWRPYPALLSWLIFKTVEANRAEDNTLLGKPSLKRKRYTTLNNKRKAAMILCSLSAKHLGYINISTASEILRSIQHKTYIVRKRGGADESHEIPKLTMDIDQLVKIVRWVQVFDQNGYSGSIEEEDNLLISPTGKAAATPNKLSPYFYRFLIISYLRVSDIEGASNILTWAREEAKLSFEDLEKGWMGDQKGFKNFIKDIAYQEGTGAKAKYSPRDILAILGGINNIGRTKSWWNRPEDF